MDGFHARVRPVLSEAKSKHSASGANTVQSSDTLPPLKLGGFWRHNVESAYNCWRLTTTSPSPWCPRASTVVFLYLSFQVLQAGLSCKAVKPELLKSHTRH